jgi:hypothetical protein
MQITSAKQPATGLIYLRIERSDDRVPFVPVAPCGFGPLQTKVASRQRRTPAYDNGFA